MLYIQHYIKTIHFWCSGIVQKTTKLIEGGHRGLQESGIRTIGIITSTIFSFFLKPVQKS